MSSVYEKVREIIAEALYVDKDEAERGASLMKDLCAESIDFLDIMFRLEKEFGIKIPKGEIESKARGGLSDADFAINGLIQPKGLEQLRKAMPDIDASTIKTGLQVRDIPSLFTVGTFERMVLERLGGVVAETESAPARASGHGARL